MTQGRQQRGLFAAIDFKQPAKELDRIKGTFDGWVKHQPPAMEVALVTAAGGAQGAFLGGVMGVMTAMDPSGAGKLLSQPPPGSNPQMAGQVAKIQQGGAWGQARNFAVMTGVNAGLTLAVKKYRGGVEDARGAMIAAFGSGAAFSLVSGMSGPQPLMGAFSTGVIFALLQGGLFKLGQSFSGPKTVDTNYVRGRYVLQTVGFSQYEKRLKKSLLTDNTIMLWDNEALREAGIPPGPRLLIMHHIEQVRGGSKSGYYK